MNRNDFAGTNLEYFEGKKYKPMGHKGSLGYDIECRSGIEDR